MLKPVRSSFVSRWLNNFFKRQIDYTISEYDEAAIIEALAEQYGVPSSSISLSITGG